MIDRNSSRRFYTNAEEYKNAATILVNIVKNKSKLTFVKYYLCCHAIELYLKAFLRNIGENINYLKKLGHNLEKCLYACKERGLEIFDTDDIKRIALLNVYYQDKDFEYTTIGAKKYPTIIDVIKLVEKIAINLEYIRN